MLDGRFSRVTSYTDTRLVANSGGNEMDLHGKIMNIQTTSAGIGNAVESAMKYDNDWESRLALAYKLGHRDARHAAAELATIQQSNQPDSGE